jgi:PKD repeat protein
VTKFLSIKHGSFKFLAKFEPLKQKLNMKKLFLLSFASVLSSFLIAGSGLPGQMKQSTRFLPGSRSASSFTSNNRPKAASRAGSLQKVMVGSAGNLLTVLNSASHCIHADSVLNTVLFVHRNDQTAACCNTGLTNVAQYRYDWSKDGGATWATNVGPVNPTADNVTICGRYPQAMIERDAAQNVADSTYFIYDGTWHDGGTPISVWQGNYYGVGQLGGPSSTYTEARDVVNNAEVEIFESLTRGTQYHYFNITRAYIQTSTTTDSIYGLVLGRGIYDPTTHATTWTSQVIPFSSAHFYDANGAPVGNAVLDPTIAFDPTGQYGWILFMADLVEDGNYVLQPQLMHSTDFGATWGPIETLDLETMPGMFTNNVTTAGTVKSIMGDAQIAVDSAGNPHVIAIVDQADATQNTYSFYPLAVNVLYDIYRNPSIAGCNWQANFLAQVFGYSGTYTVASGADAAVSEGNRVQVARTDDGKKIFAFWNDSDSSVVSALTASDNTNPSPNLFGVGIDMTVRKVTDIKNFTAGDSLFGGTTVNSAQGALHGSLFPAISQNVLPKTGGVFNIPAILTEPDYRAALSLKTSGNPARFYYCQNINFTQSDFVNKFDNAPPTLIVGGGDTVWVRKGQPYTPPTASASDCQYGVITPTYTSDVHTDANHNTDSVGVFHSVWTATNPDNNSSTHTQTVIVADVPIAHITYVKYTGKQFAFQDSSENLPTNHVWTWGDGSSNNFNVTRFVKTYTSSGQKMVTLTVSNQFGTDKDTAYVNVTIGINDPEFAKTVNVYPNPSKGVVTVEMPSDINDGAVVTVYNSLGEVATEPITIASNKTVLNLNHLSSGVYLMKVESASGKIAIKELSINK